MSTAFGSLQISASLILGALQTNSVICQVGNCFVRSSVTQSGVMLCSV